MANEVTFRLSVDGANAVVADTGRVGAALGGVGRQSQVAAVQAETLSSALGRVAHYGLAGGAIAGLVSTVREATSAMFAASSSAQRLAVQLDFASDGKGAAGMAYVTGLANKLGLEINSTAKAYAGFASAARGTSLEGEKTQAVFTAISKASAVMGLSTDETRGALLAVQQMMSKGVVSAEEFRGQLGERMPIALQAGARALGVTTAEFSKLLETGKIIAEDFLPKFAVAIEAAVGGAAEKASQRLDASVARMGNAFEKLKQMAGDSGIAKSMAETNEQITLTMTAMSESIARSAAGGSGSLRQMAEAASTLLARALGFNYFVDAWSTLNERLAATGVRVGAAEKELQQLQAALNRNPGDILLGGAIADTQKLIDKLREAQVALKGLADESSAETARLTEAALRSAGLLGNNSPGEDARLTRQIGKSKERGEVLAKYASDAQKLRDELAKVGEAFDGVIPKDLEQSIRAKFIKPTHEARTAFADLSGDIKKTIETLNLRNAAGGELSKAQQLEIDLTHRLTEALAKLKPGEKARLDALVSEAVAAQALGEHLADQAKARDAVNKAAGDYLDGLAARAKSAEDETQSLRDQYIELTAGKKVLAELVSTRLEERAVALDRLADATPWLEEAESLRLLSAKLREQIALRKGIATATDNNEVDAANKAAADKALQEWQRSADQIGQSLADQLMQGGKSGADYIKNLFRTMVLRPVIQGLVQPVAGAVAGFLGGGAPAGAAGASGTLQNASALYQAYNALSSGAGIAGGVGTAVFGNSAAYGAAIGTANVGAGSQAAMLAAQTGQFGLAGNVATSQAAAGAGSGYISMASTVGWAALAVAAVNQASNDYDKGWTRDAAGRDARNVNLAINPVASLVTGLGKLNILSDKWTDVLSGDVAFARAFGRKAPEVQDSGFSGSISGGDFTGKSFADIKEKGGWFRSDKNYTQTAEVSDALGRLMDDSAKAILDKAGDFGKALGLPVEALQSVSTELRISLGDDAKKNEAAIVASLASYGDALVKGWAEALAPLSLYGESTIATIERVGAAIKGTNDVLGLLHVPLLAASVAGGEAAVALAAAFGGLDQLAQASSAYYNEFFTDAERAADSTKAMSQALAGVGLQVPATRDALKAVVSGLDLTNEAQREQYRALMQVSGAFAKLNPVLESTAKAVRSAADILKEREGLEMQQLRLLGDTVAIRNIEREALDANNRSLYDQVKALEDSQAAQVAATAAADAASAAAKTLANEAISRARAVAQEDAGLQQRWLQLMGDTAALREIERAALDDTNRALFDRITALEDEKAAAVLADQALKDAAASSAKAVQAAESLARAMQTTLSQLAAGVDNAYASVESTIGKERARVIGLADDELRSLDKQADTTQGVFDTLKNSLGGLIDSLQGAIESLTGSLDTEAARLTAKATISEQIATARAGGTINIDASKTAAGVLAKNDTAGFSSRVDFMRESYQSAGLLQELAGAAQDQIGTAERAAAASLAGIVDLRKAVELSRDKQVDLLDAQLDTARLQYEALTGISTSVATVASTLGTLASAMAALGAASGKGGPTNQWLQSGQAQSWLSGGGAVATSAVGASSDAIIRGKSGTNFTASEAQAWVKDRVGAGDLVGIYNRAIAEGIDSASLDALMGWSPGTSLGEARRLGLPAFAAGGRHSGGLRVVGEQGPELEATGASRIWNAQDTAAMLGNGGRRDEVLVAEIKALREVVSALRSDAQAQQAAIASHANKTATLLDKFDIDGMPPVRT